MATICHCAEGSMSSPPRLTFPGLIRVWLSLVICALGLILGLRMTYLIALSLIWVVSDTFVLASPNGVHTHSHTHTDKHPHINSTR